MAESFSWLVNEPAERLDRFLSARQGLSRSQVQKWIREGLVVVNGQPAKPAQKLSPGDRVVVTPPPPQPTPLTPEDIPLSIIYEDQDVIAIDKPAGLTAHPAPGHPGGTLVNALLSRFPALAQLGGDRPGLVHRLDRDTSGVMVVAKNEAARLSLARQFKDRTVEKGYLVLVQGKLTPTEGVIEAPLGRHPRQRQKRAVVAGGREARTRYRVLQHLGGFSLVEAWPETGRTHQIRVHFAAIGYPVAGDRMYGVKVPFLSRQFVHARYLHLRHPAHGRQLAFESPLAPDLAQALAWLESTPGPA